MTYVMEAHGTTTTAGPDGPWIMGTLQRRKDERGIVHSQMRRIRDAYNDDIWVPLPELGTDERSSVANLIVTGVDQTAQRIASVMPNVDFPSLRPGFDNAEASARERTMVMRSWWEANKLARMMRRRSRHLVAYGSAPVIIRPNAHGMPVWSLRDPLSTYPAPTQDPDDACPRDVIFTYYQPMSWLRDNYFAKYQEFCAQTGNKMPDGSLQVELVEYVDCEVTVLAVLGMKQSSSQWNESFGLVSNPGAYVELERTVTPGGICPAVIPGRVTLDRPRGQFDAQIGMYTMQARLMALEIIATEKGIFPETYLESRQGETAQFLAGPYDGRSGKVNVVKGGQVREMTSNPGWVAGNNIIDRIERAQRISGGIPAEYGGESPVNVRTGKRGDAVMAAITSFPVQEAQETLAIALEEESHRAVVIAKACAGSAKRSIYYNAKGGSKALEYQATKLFDSEPTERCKVTYPMPGADANTLVISNGQRVGMGTMSRRTAMENDPSIADAEMEDDRIVAEGLRDALIASIQQQAVAGAIPPSDISSMAAYVTQNKGDIFAAVEAVHKAAQERQASNGEPGTPTGPVPPGSPEAQPGLAAPGTGAEQPTIGPPPEGLQNFSQFAQMLR